MYRSHACRPRQLLAVAAAVAAFAVAGCGGSTSGSSGDTLTIAAPSFPTSLDPATGENGFSTYFDLAYDPLIVKAPDGSYKPGLAEHWEYGPDNESFKITLRSGVKFSDGTPLDAAAVKTWIEHAIKLPGGRASLYLETLKSIDVEGPLTLTLHFSEPTPLLELVFSQALEMGSIGSPKAVRADTLATRTDGTGPYMLDPDETVARDHYTFVPNPYYWNKDAVHWKKVVVKTIASPSAALQALQTGQVQVARDQPATSVNSAKDAGLSYVDPLALLMGMDLLDRGGTLVKPLGDVRVRQALNYAVDRAALAKVVGAGVGKPTTQMAAPGDDSYDKALEQAYPYDPAKAKQLLTEAGYPNGFTLPAVSTTEIGQHTLGQAIAGQLSKVGVKLELDVKPDGADYAEELASGKVPAATLSWGRLPAANQYQLLWGPEASFNPFKTRSAKLEALNKSLRAAPSDEAATIGSQIQDLLVKQAWFLPVASTPLVALYTNDVTGVNAGPGRPYIYVNEIQPAR